MQKIISFLFFICVTTSVFAQNSSMQMIYDGSFYGITNFQDFKIKNLNKKFIYIQNGVNYNSYINNPNESGYYLKLNKNNNSWYLPHNGFLNSIWVWAYWENPPRLSCIPFRLFSISSFDTNIIFKNAIYWVYGWTDPEERNYLTTNGGANFFDPLFDGYNPVYSSGCTCGGVELDSTDVLERYKVLIGYSWRFSFSGPIYRGLIESVFNSQTFLSEIPQLKNVCNGGFIKINPFNRNYIYAVENTMLLSTSSGANFMNLNIPPLKFIEFDYTDRHVYGATNTKLFKSTTNGLNWDSLNLPFRANTIEISPDQNNIFYAGTDSGLYRSTNKGISWALYNNSFLPSKKIIGLSKDSGTGDTLYVCTDRAVYKVWRDFLVNINDNEAKIHTFRLHQNYPNPFNPKTIINYDIIENKGLQPLVQLKVYDALGKEVVTLVNEHQNKGYYEVTFDGSNLPSGIYFYKLETENYSETKRMILLK